MPPEHFRLFLRISLFDLIILPTSQKLQEHNVLANLSKIFSHLWNNSYKAIDPRVVQSPSELPTHNVGEKVLSARQNLPLWMSLRDWLTIGTQSSDWGSTSYSADSSSHRLPLSSAARKAYWVRFVTVLESLQNAGYVRDALNMANPHDALLNVLIEFRYFAILLYLQTVRTQPHVWLKPALSIQNEAASLTGRRPRSASDGALEQAWPASVQDMRSPTTSRLSPRHRDGSMTTRMRSSQPVGRLSKEEVPNVIDTLMRYLPIMLALAGCHFDTVAKLLQTDGRQPSVIEATLKRYHLAAAHTKYMALLFQGYESSPDGSRRPLSSHQMEARLNSALWSPEHFPPQLKVAPMVSVTEFINLLCERLEMQIATSDVVTCFTLAPSGARQAAYRNNKAETPTKAHPLLSPRNSGKSVNDSDVSTPREPLLKSEPTRHDLQVISSRRKELIYVPQSPTGKCLDDLTIIDCQDCWVFGTTQYLNVKIGNCRNVRCILPCVAGSVVVHFGRQVTVHACCYGALVSNCYDTKLFLLSRSPPVIVGDTRDTVLGPYNVAFQNQRAWLGRHDIRYDADSLRMWSIPIVCPLGTANRSSTPRDENRKGDSRNAQDEAYALDGGLMPGCARPSELEVLMYPSESPTVPLLSDPSNLILPETHAQAVAQGMVKRQRALNAYLARLERCRDPAQKQAFLQESQSRFVEWLQGNKKMHDLLARGDLGGFEVLSDKQQRLHRLT